MSISVPDPIWVVVLKIDNQIVKVCHSYKNKEQAYRVIDSWNNAVNDYNEFGVYEVIQSYLHKGFK